jgi:aminoglycoside/choline kinase family phosphotransferase
MDNQTQSVGGGNRTLAARRTQLHPSLHHRDYHPVNVLWQNGEVSGVVDWVNACLGPAGADVAHCRANLAQMFGVGVAEEFLQAYLERAGGEYNPFWDVDSVLNMSWPQPRFYLPWNEFGLT